MHVMWRIQSFIKQWNDTVGVLGLKLFVIQDSVLKLNSRLSFYYGYPVAEMPEIKTM